MAEETVPTGRLRRLARLVQMAPGAGLALLRPDDGDRVGDLVTDTLGKLKGGSMKVGQIVAQVADDLPPAMRARLGALYGQAPALGIEQVRAVIAEELGAPVEERFAEFEPVPAASASLGQVHRARLPDGTPVAVKVQYPGVDQALRDDLDMLNTTRRAVTMGGVLFDSTGYFDAMRDLTLGELDYRQEHDARDRMAAAVARWPDLVVPRVYGAHSSRRVLTLDWLEGPTLHGWAEAEHPQAEKDALAERFIRGVYGPLATAGLANADAHPGNFIVLEDGRLGLLDFGAVARVPAAEVEGTFALGRALRDGVSGTALVEALRGAGFLVTLPPGRAERMAEALAAAVGPSLRGVVDFGVESPMARFAVYKREAPIESVGLRPTPPILPILRAAMGLQHGLRRLAARVDLGATLLGMR